MDKNNYFKKCYESCDLCEIGGNDTHHNCIKCNTDYFYELNISNYLNCYDKCEFNFYYDEINNKYHCTPDENCVNYYDKKISEKKQCVHDCKDDKDFPFEFQKNCYSSCPVNISEISKDKNYCEIKCPKDMPYELIETQTCVKKCTIYQLYNELCKINFNNGNITDSRDKQEEMVENIRNEITNGIDTSGIDNGKDIIIQEKDIVVTITKNSNQKNQINSKSNTSSIDLGECEKKVKKLYNIPDNDSLYILKMDVKQEGYKIPKIQYEVYYPLYNDSKLNLLNLSICEETDIDIYLPLSFNGSLNLIDPNSDFYNDICNTFTSDDGTDLTLSERKKNFINNNLTVCEENCDFVKYNETIEKAVCSCQTKTNFNVKISENNFKSGEFLKSFIDFKNIFNINILKCVKLIFSLGAFKENFANIILIIIISLYFICLILFIFIYYKKDILFYINFIIYFILYPINISNITETNKIEVKKKEQKKEQKKNEIKKEQKKKELKKELKKKEIKKEQKKKELKKALKKKKFHINKKNKNSTDNTYNIDTNSKNKSFHKNNKHLKKFRIDELKNMKKKNIETTENETESNQHRLKFQECDSESNLNKKIKQSKFKNSRNYENKIKTENNQIKNIKLEERFNNSKELSKLYIKIYSRTDNELNNLTYFSALKYDKRKYFEYYFSLIRSKHIIFFAFYPKFDFNSRIIKIYLLFFNFATFFFINALFFTDETMGKINSAKGVFDIINNIPQILYSNLISSFINEFINMLALTEDNLIEFRNRASKIKIFKLSKFLKRYIKIKFVIFFILNLILLCSYWIYLSCFSAVYKNTQIHLIKDTIISFGTSFITPMVFYLIPGIFRIISLRNNKRKILYIITMIFQFF